MVRQDHDRNGGGVFEGLRTRHGLRLALAAGLAVGLGQIAWAGPQGERVVRGTASFSRSGHETVIHAGHNSIIHYQSFNIAPHQTVRFIQPDASSRVLNRITGPDPSRIDGTLIANGRVYIVNPAGVYFGNGATVNVGAIYAAAGTMTDADFLAGVDRFGGLSGRVSNLGTIRGREVHLIGRTVENFGTLVTPEGLVTMSAGDDVLIGRLEGGVFARIESREGSAGGELRQHGRVEAEGGRVLMGTGDVFALAIGADAYVRAAQVRAEGGGAAHAVTVEGRIDARDQGPGGRGGEIQILGDRIALVGAELDASGAHGGGRVRVGGGYQGGEGLRAAERVYVDRESVVRADATAHGRGGDVVVWSEGLTSYHGRITARGGAMCGDGGFVEVSGKELLRFDGWVDVSAPLGRDGTILLDPRDITIVETGADDAELTLTGILFGAPSSTDDFTISAAALEALTGNIELQAQRDLTVDFALNLANQTGGETVTFRAGRDIRVNAGVTTAGGDLLLLANDATTPNPPGAQNGSVFVSAPVNLVGGSFTSSGVGFTSSSLITATAATLNHTGALSLGAMTLGAGGLDANAGTTIATTGLLNITGPSAFNAGGTITLSQITPGGSLLLTTPVGASVTSTGPIQFANLTSVGGTLAATAQVGTITNTGTMSVGGASSFTASAPGLPPVGIDLSGFAAGGALTLTTPASVSIATTGGLALGGTSVIGGTATLNANAGGSAITGGSLQAASANLTGSSINLTGVNVPGSLTLNTAGNATIAATSAVTLGAGSNIGSGLSVTTSAGSITDAGTVTVTGAVTLNAAGAINVDTFSTSGGAYTLTAGSGGATVVNQNAVTIAGATISGPLRVTGGGSVTNTGAITVTNGTATPSLFSATVAGFINLGQGGAFAATGPISMNTIGGNATLVGTSALNLGATSITGTLSVTAQAGAITNTSGTIAATTGASFTTLAGNITVNNLAVTSPVTLSGSGNVTLSNTGNLALQGSVGGNLIASSTGTLTDSAALAVTGGSVLTGSNGIVFDQTTFTGSVGLFTTSGNATVTAPALVLAGSNVSGDLFATVTVGALAGAGATVTVGGNAELSSVGNLSFPALNITGSVLANSSGGSVTLTNAGTLRLASGTNAFTTLTATATTGDLLNLGAVNAGGAVSLQAVAGDLEISGLVTPSTVRLRASGDVTYSAASIALGGGNSQAGGLMDLTATGGSLTGTGLVAPNARLEATGAITLTDVAVGGEIVLNSGGASSLSAVGPAGIVLGAGTVVGGNLTLFTPTGDIRDAGAVTVLGTAIDLHAQGGDIDFDTTTASLATWRLRSAGDARLSAGTVQFDVATSAIGGDLTLAADTLTPVGVWSGTLGSGGLFTLAPRTPGTPIFLGTATGAGLEFSGADLAELATTGFGSLGFGEAGVSPVTIASAAFNLPTIVRGTTIIATGPITTGGAALTLDATTGLTLSGTINTGAGALDLVGPITLAGATTLQGGALTVTDTIDGGSTLTVSGVTADFGGAIGANAALASFALTTTGGAGSLGDVRTSGAQTYTNSSSVTLTGDLRSTGGGTISFAGPVLLGGAGTRSIRIDGAPSGTNAVTFAAPVNGARTLAIEIGAARARFAGIGNTTAPTGLSVNGGLTLLGDVTLAGPLSATGSLLLNTPAVSMTTGNGAVSLLGGVQGASAWTLDAGSGAVEIASGIGNSTPLTSVTLTGGAVSLPSIGTALNAGVSGSLTVNASGLLDLAGANYRAGTVSLTAAGGQRLNQNATVRAGTGSVSLLGGGVAMGAFDLDLLAPGGSVTVAGATGNGAADLTVIAVGPVSLGAVGSAGSRIGTIRLAGSDVNLNGTVFGTVFEAQPTNPTDAITLGGAGGAAGFALSATEMSRLGTGFTSVTFGRDAGQHAVELRGFSFVNPVFVRAPGGSVAITGDLAGSGGSALDLAAGSITLGSSITTGGGAVRFGAPTSIVGGVRGVSAGSGAVRFEGDVQGPGGLVVRGGAVRFDADLGSMTPMGVLDGEGSTSLRFGGSVIRAASARLAAAGGELLFAGSGLDLETTGGNATLLGSTIRLGAGVTSAGVRTSGGDVRLQGPLNGTVGATPATLLIDAGAGDVLATAPIGEGAPLASVAIGGDAVTLRGVRTTGSQSVTAQSLTLDGLFASSLLGSLVYAGPVTLAGDVEARSAGAPGQDVRFNAVNGPFALTLDAGAGGGVRTGAVGLVQPLASFDVRGASVELGSVVSSGAIAVDAPASVGGLVRSLDAGVTFTRALTLTSATTIEGRGGDVRLLGPVDGSVAVALLAPGREIVADAPIGANTPLASLDAAGASIRLADVSTTGAQTYAGAVLLGGRLSTTGGGLTLNFPLTLLADSALIAPSGGVQLGAVSGAFDLLLDAGANDLDLTAGLGQSAGLGRLTIERAGAVAFDAIRADSVRIEDASSIVTLPGVASLTGSDGFFARAGGLTLTGRLESAGDLVIDSGGAIRIAASADLGAFSGSIIQTGGGEVRLEQELLLVGGGLSFQGTVTLGTGVSRFTGSSLVFDGGIEPSGGGVGLVLASPGTIRLGGQVGGSTPFASVTTTGGGITELGGSVFAIGEVFFDGATVLVGDSFVEGRRGVRFGGGIESEADATHTLEIAVDTSELGRDLALVRFGGPVGVVNRPRALSINLAGRGGAAAEVPTIVFFDEAAIFGAPSAANGLLFRVSETFAVGRGEKIAAVGPVGIEAGTSASFGDISSLGDIDVLSPRIVLLLRPGQPVFDPVLQAATPESADQGIDFVSATAIRFSSTPELDGQGGLPQFATLDAGGITSSLANQFSIRAFTTLNREDLIRGDQYFDLRAQGATNTNVAEALAGATPRQDASRSVVSELGVGAAQGEQLQRLGVFPKELTPEQLVEFLVGRAVYMDLNPEAAVQASAARVTVDRLSERIVSSVLATYQSVFGEAGSDAFEREMEIRERLDEALFEYRASGGEGRFDPAAFRGFLEFNERHGPVAQDVRELQRLFDELNLLGLSPLELGVAREVLLGGICPDSLSTGELLGVIQAPTPRFRAPAAGAEPLSPAQAGESGDEHGR